MPSWIRVVEDSVPEVGQRPVYLVRREFSIGAVPVSATLRISAHGLYTAFINGVRVGNDELTPGYTEYPVHTQYQQYQVAHLLRQGGNVIVAELADGWYRGGVGLLQLGDNYGTHVELWAELTEDTTDGVTLVATDENWVSTTSHILSADLFKGQNEDLRLRDADNYLSDSVSNARTALWRSMVTTEYAGKLFPQAQEPNRVTQYLTPKSIRRLGPTTQVVDFGQNINGWTRLSKLGEAGNKITLTHGEWLAADGTVTQENLNVNFPIFPNPVDAHQIDSVISDGSNSVFEPRYTTHGFQFVQVDGLSDDLVSGDIAAAVVHTDLRRIGHFRSSDDRINWLHDTAVWSFRGNACDLPTDCPTRERSGWTGDWQLYVETAAFLYDVREFNRKFLADVRLNQRPDGKVMNIAPFERVSTEGIPGNSNGSSGWGDVVVQAPLMMWREYGDVSQLEENFQAMLGWLDFASNMAANDRHPSRAELPKKEHEDFLWDSGYHWGEWMEADGLEFDFFKFRETDKGLVATSFLHRSARDAALAAEILGKPAAVVAKLNELAERSRLAWREEYLNVDGTLTQPTQANYARSLAFGLIPEQLVASSAAELNRLVIENGYRLTTGFLTTPLLLPVLADHGYLETAYRLLFQEQSPSWLAMRNRGATTIWEQWEGVDAEGVPHESLNHYSKGAVITFLHQYTAGLKSIEPAYRRFAVAPKPITELQWIELSLESPQGLIQLAWKQEAGQFRLDLTVPAGAAAEVTLPDGSFSVLESGEHRLTCKT